MPGSMSQFLAEAYGTHAPLPSEQDMQKQASIELFAKLAADEGVDLTKLSDADVSTLFQNFQEKLAEEEKKEEKDKEKKETEGMAAAEKGLEKAEKAHESEKDAQARQEFALQKEAEAKVAEADYLGRVMAHAYVNELKKIASAGIAAPAAAAPAATPEVEKTAGKADKAIEHVGGHLKNFGKAMKSHKTETAAVGGAAAGAAAEHGRNRAMNKKGSALDLEAAEYGVKLAHASELDAEMVGEHLDALLTLGAPESVKTAGVENYEQAVHIRALELLEQIGVPVTWNT